MIEFLIKQLDISEQDAKIARENPESFYINYDTYKIFISNQ